MEMDIRNVTPELQVGRDDIDVAVALQGRVALRLVEHEAVALGRELIRAGEALAADRASRHAA